MRIAIIVEGKTEEVFLSFLRDFLKNYLVRNMPKIDPVPCNGRIPKGDVLKKVVKNLLAGKNSAHHVIALTDVYTGTQPPEFKNAQDAKKKMREWVGEESRFHPHAAQYDFEAWLIPYWSTIQDLAGVKVSVPNGNPEEINNENPPIKHIKSIFSKGKIREYVKARDAKRILKKSDLMVAIKQCKELKALVNTILSLSGSEEIE